MAEPKYLLKVKLRCALGVEDFNVQHNYKAVVSGEPAEFKERYVESYTRIDAEVFNTIVATVHMPVEEHMPS